MKSQCCNANIEVDKGGVGVFSLTMGSYTCSKCRKYCICSDCKEHSGVEEEKINDAIDTEDLGAKADYEWAKEKDESVR